MLCFVFFVVVVIPLSFMIPCYENTVDIVDREREREKEGLGYQNDTAQEDKAELCLCVQSVCVCTLSITGWAQNASACTIDVGGAFRVTDV